MNLPPFTDELIDKPDEQVGEYLIAWWIGYQAELKGIPIAELSIEVSKAIVKASVNLDTNNVEVLALEKAIRKAAVGDYKAAGRLLKTSMKRDAKAQKYIPIGISKSKQASDFGKKGAESNKEIGSTNKIVILDVAKKILAERKRGVSDHELARLIQEEVPLATSTIRNHLRKLRKENLLD